MTIRVLLADDQPLVRAGLRGILETSPDFAVVGEAADGEEAVRLTRELRPDVTCMDIQMPGMDGLRATARISAERGATAVLVLTTFDQDDYVFSALRAGASGFIIKTAPPETILDAVRTVAAGDALLSPSVTRRVIERFHDRVMPDLPLPVAASGLTEREVDVVRLVAEGLSNDEIAEALVLSSTTVKTHVSNVLGKLGLRDRVQLVVFAFRNRLV